MSTLQIIRLKQKIRFRKFLLNFLLTRIQPTNKIVIIISQNLDKYIALCQQEIYIQRYSKKTFTHILAHNDQIYSHIILHCYSSYFN